MSPHPSLFGRQGTAMGASEKALQCLKLMGFIKRVGLHGWIGWSQWEGIKSNGKWHQLTLQRWHKHDILLDAGSIFEDPALLDSWGELEVIKLLC